MKAYQENFSRASLYDSWEAVKNNLPNSAELLRTQLEKYTKDSGNNEEILRLQGALPTEKIQEFDSRIKEWGARGYTSLSDPDWFSKTFKIDPEGIMNQIDLFNKKVDSVVKGIGK